MAALNQFLSIYHATFITVWMDAVSLLVCFHASKEFYFQIL